MSGFFPTGWRWCVFAAALVLTMGAPPTAPAQTGGNVPELPRREEPGFSGPFGSPQLTEGDGESYSFRGAEGVRYVNDIGYGIGRSVVEYQNFRIEADRIVVDFVSGDIQVEGEVLFTGPQEFIRATSGRFNFFTSEGVAYGVNGQAGDFYFQAVWDEEVKGPTFTQIDRPTTIFRGSHMTTNPFPVPMYYVTASEAIYVRRERVFLRNPVLWVRGVPVLWLPAYSRSLAEGSPWSQEFGYNSDLGAYLRIGYRYIHRVQTPALEDPTQYRSRSHGLLDTRVDFLGLRGVGAGAEYRYQFDYKRHGGYLNAYAIRDRRRFARNLDREFPDINLDEEIDELDLQEIGYDEERLDQEDGELRWVYQHKHVSEVVNDLFLQIDIDEASDPDVYYDILDYFTPDGVDPRGRLFEQHLRGALTWRHDNFIARIAAERRERLALDRYQDFSDPYNDDLDFDPDPIFIDEFELEENEGIPSRRYATVSERATARLATRLLNIGTAPLYYRFEANAFTALDSGFNPLDTGDDTNVRGIDLYGSLTHRLKLGARTTWTNTVGVGASLAERDDDEIVSDDDFFPVGFVGTTPVPANALLPNGTIDPDFVPIPGQGLLPDGTRVLDGNVFPDQNTIRLGGVDGTTEVDASEIDNTYVFVDYRTRLNHRFTNYLDGYIEYLIREGTDDSLGEYYEQIGRLEAFEDIHDFYTNRHTVEAGLNYFLRFPDILMSLVARENLQSDDDIYANEELRFVGYTVGYVNPARDFTARLGMDYQERQFRDRGSPDEFDQPSIGGVLDLEYTPRHARYWGALRLSGRHTLEEDPVLRDARQIRRFDEEDTEFIISPIIGRQFGPKYRAQLAASYNTRLDLFQDVGVTLIRDLYDAELALFFGMRAETSEEVRDDDNEEDEVIRETDYEYDIRANIRFKIGRDLPGLGQRSITTISDLQREAAFVQ